MNETTPRDIPAEVRAEIESDPLVGIIAEDGRYFGPYHDEATDTVYDGLGRPVDVEAMVARTRRHIREGLQRYEERYRIPSSEFYQRWQQDGLQDSLENSDDFYLWAQMYRDARWMTDEDSL
ncbi:MAG: hypothetical protein ISS49_06960 [Anaerolineae bacterium]|nr:hypothetical protein [Anaerolineae bacterium]